MTDLNRKALNGVFGFVFTVGACILVAAGTLDYWQAWLFISVLFLSILGITLYLMRNDPDLLARRLRAGPGAESRKSQKVGQLFGAMAFLATLVLPALDHRFAWSSVPLLCVIAGDALVALGLFIVFRVFRENTFTSATIETAPEQRVVSGGPYSVVRHPMYVGALIMIFGIPPALGSWWGLAPAVLMALVIVQRVRDEERLLASELTGYAEYRNQVRYRLLPHIW